MAWDFMGLSSSNRYTEGNKALFPTGIIHSSYCPVY